MEDCIFCRIAAHTIPSDIVLEDEHFVAFRDLHPIAPQHVLVVPKAHVSSLNDVPTAWQAAQDQALLAFIVRVAELLGVAETGYRVVVNVGPDGGQEVDHLHFHVIGGRRMGHLG